MHGLSKSAPGTAFLSASSTALLATWWAPFHHLNPWVWSKWFQAKVRLSGSYCIHPGPWNLFPLLHDAFAASGCQSICINSVLIFIPVSLLLHHHQQNVCRIHFMDIRNEQASWADSSVDPKSNLWLSTLTFLGGKYHIPASMNRSSQAAPLKWTHKLPWWLSFNQSFPLHNGRKWIHCSCNKSLSPLVKGNELLQICLTDGPAFIISSTGTGNIVM